MLRDWVDVCRKDERVRALVAALRPGPGAVARAGSVYGSAQAMLLAALAGEVPGPLVVVALGVEEADDIALDLAAFGHERVLRFPAWEALPVQDALPNFSIFAERLEMLRRLAAGEDVSGVVVVAPIGAVLQPVPEPEDVKRASIPLRKGEDVPPELLEQALSKAGFERVAMVELPGEWSRRGGIMDVFPLAGGGPYRLEWFGDTIESIREIDTESQRSLRELGALEVILSGTEAIFRGADALKRSLLDYLPAQATLAVVEPARVEGMAIELSRRFGSGGAYLPAAAWIEGAQRFRRLEMSALPLELGVSLDTRSVERATGSKVEEIAVGIRGLIAQGEYVTILAPKDGERARLRELLEEHKIHIAAAGSTKIAEGLVRLEAGDVSKGFGAPRLGRALLTSRELFRQALVRRPPPRAGRRKQGRPIASFLELSAGDLVVHVVHGIGRFQGIELLDQDGRIQEYLRVEYAENTLVYVPATKIELVQRYVGAKGFTPHLSKIGTAGWQKHKDRVKAAVMDLAAELIEIQAAREVRSGPPYPPDDAWQEQFEASFAFEDTPDQVTATAAIKGDLSSTRPMDRLVCGDVGYGKTELAMRAAFKIAQAGKQVAILVPTTILAEQHLESFRARMSEFPVTIECVNRFRSGKEANAILRRVKAGEVDILIGTHRILSQDVEFKDLGLVVIDEEQRFGVGHKERLKRLRKTVDVLTMTATPIPRTLHMSLLGIKDISALETPPAGRLAIETIIARDTPEMVREAILRELAREGQVYFVHNRVYSIQRRAEELMRLVPEASFAVVHGQMDEDVLESRMMEFVHGRVDVLVTTTIIESGLDIPRANTIFIDRADNFGLADLHQLRGRVGRYKHRAYAYLMLPRNEAVTEIAERRLKAIEEFNDLGAGFRIAMRDLEIRGAGNILGPEQSGHIATVGYDLYCRLLSQAVEELRRLGPAARAAPVAPHKEVEFPADATPEEKIQIARAARAEQALRDAEAAREAERIAALPQPAPEAGIEVELNVDAHIPDRYIPDPKQKIEAYRKLAAAHEDETLVEVEKELRDRFGPLPEPVRILARLNRLRVACELLSIGRVSAEAKVGVLKYAGNGAALKRQLAYSRTKALWPEPGTCFAVIAEDGAGLKPEQALERLISALCVERQEAAPSDKQTGVKRLPQRPTEKRARR